MGKKSKTAGGQAAKPPPKAPAVLSAPVSTKTQIEESPLSKQIRSGLGGFSLGCVVSGASGLSNSVLLPTVLVTLGISGLGAALWLEKLRPAMKIACTGLLIGTWASLWVLSLHPYVAAPEIIASYPPPVSGRGGAEYAGIRWNDLYREVSVRIINRSDFDLVDLDVTLSADYPIIAAGQKQGNVPCQVLLDETMFTTYSAEVTIGSGPNKIVKPIDPAEPNESRGDGSFLGGTKRVSCTKIPKHSSTSLVLALADFSPLDRPSKTIRLNGEYRAARRAIKFNHEVN